MMQIAAVNSAHSSYSYVGRARVDSPAGAATGGGAPGDDSAAAAGGSATVGSAASSSAVNELTVQEQRIVAQLKETDRLVRAHEQAHVAAGGGLVRGGANFSFTSGPDQQRYAVAGEVSIDISPGATPPETIAKAQQIRAAALAPADPSAQDLRVAARATSMESEARVELARAQRDALAADERNAEGGTQGSGQAALFYQAVAVSGGGVPGRGLDVYA